MLPWEEDLKKPKYLSKLLDDRRRMDKIWQIKTNGERIINF